MPSTVTIDPPAEPGPLADAHHEIRDSSGRLLARCSLWWSHPPATGSLPAGMIGRYAATTAEAGVQLLDAACRDLSRHGCRQAVGPIDGGTWGSYRFVTGGSSEPPFFLEPDHPREWPDHFETAGFTPLARYFSTVTDDLDRPEPKADRAWSRLHASGCSLRRFDPTRPQDELRSLHRVSLAAFAHAFLYQPIGLDEFVARQQKLLPLVRPELVLIAERAGETVGFVFAIPDLCQARRGEAIDTVIIKTLAVLPGRAQAGLGVYLVQKLHHAARTLGYRRVIHALMHETNSSLNIFRATGRPLREYTLFAKAL